MDNNILNILIKSACESGQISDTDKEIIYKKAQQLGVAKEEVDKKIEQELANATSNNDLESGFIPMDELDNDTQEQQTVNNQPLQQSKFTDLKPLSYQGAMSIVFQAKQYGKWIIIKRIKPEFKDNVNYKELFIREFENAYHLDHPNIVRLLDKGEDNEGLYYTMEFIDGRPLTELIKNQGLENKKLVPKIAKQILDALTYVHKKQIVHRDLKPDNIYITYRGDNVKIIDFGLADADYFDNNLAKAGTPRYAAPEQMKPGSEIDQRADIYAFGKIFLEMLTGTVDSNNINKVENEAYRYILEKSLKPQPQNRFHSCEDILDVFENPDKYKSSIPFVNNNQTETSTQNNKTKQTDNQTVNHQQIKNGKSKKGLIIGLIAGAVVILAIIAGVFLFGNKNGINGLSDNKSELVAKADSLFDAGNFSEAQKIYETIDKKDEHINKQLKIINEAFDKLSEIDKIFDGKNIAKAQPLYKQLLDEYQNFNEAKIKLQTCDSIIKNANFETLKPVQESATNLFGLADENGNVVIDYQFDEVKQGYYLSDAIGLIPVVKNNKYGFIARNKEIVPCEYVKMPQAINMAGKGYYYLTGKNGKKYYLFTDDTGAPVIESK